MSYDFSTTNNVLVLIVYGCIQVQNKISLCFSKFCINNSNSYTGHFDTITK